MREFCVRRFQRLHHQARQIAKFKVRLSVQLRRDFNIEQRSDGDVMRIRQRKNDVRHLHALLRMRCGPHSFFNTKIETALSVPTVTECEVIGKMRRLDALSRASSAPNTLPGRDGVERTPPRVACGPTTMAFHSEFSSI